MSSPDPSTLPVVNEDIENVGASTIQFLKRHPWYFTIPLVVAVVLEIIFIVIVKPTDASWYYIPLVLPFIGYSIANGKIQQEFMQQFAAANGFTFAARGSLAGLDGTLFQIGDDRSVVNIVSGQFQNYPLSLFTYIYHTGFGRSRQTHSYTIYELQFDIAMPDILLESAGHAFGESLFDKLSGVGGIGGGSGKEMVKLEGDFNKYFSLSIPRGYEVEALEIFTPDVMAELIDKAKGFSLEIVNGHLFIYDRAVVGTKQGLYDLYGLAQYFIEKLGPVLARMKAGVAAMEEVGQQIT